MRIDCQFLVTESRNNSPRGHLPPRCLSEYVRLSGILVMKTFDQAWGITGETVLSRERYCVQRVQYSTCVIHFSDAIDWWLSMGKVCLVWK